jgi:hypothetical protein
MHELTSNPYVLKLQNKVRLERSARTLNRPAGTFPRRGKADQRPTVRKKPEVCEGVVHARREKSAMHRPMSAFALGHFEMLVPAADWASAGWALLPEGNSVKPKVALRNEGLRRSPFDTSGRTVLLLRNPQVRERNKAGRPVV